MKLIAALLLVALCHAAAEPKKKAKPAAAGPITSPVEGREAAEGLSPTAARTSDFQGDDIKLGLRTLARQARRNVVVADNVRGTVTLRINDKTPKETFDVVCASKGLNVSVDKEGVYLVSDPNAPAATVKEESAAV